MGILKVHYIPTWKINKISGLLCGPGMVGGGSGNSLRGTDGRDVKEAVRASPLLRPVLQTGLTAENS